MEHTHCHELLGSLSEYVDGALEQAVCAEIERHLQGCENCRIVIDSLRKTVYLYQVCAEQSPEVPADVRQRLYHCLDLDAFLEKADEA
jgi:predicted anti-sigma-YlaC factor YlaD